MTSKPTDGAPAPKQHGAIVSDAHDWRSNPFWPQDATNPLARSVLRCRLCGAITLVGKWGVPGCTPREESPRSGFTDIGRRGLKTI